MPASLESVFRQAGCCYPPKDLTFIALKDERFLEVWAPGEGGEPRLVKQYEILAASGASGPKLKEGDLQVPEGVYSIVLLNPNSRFHLSMKLDYPNSFDRRMARCDGRTRLGGDIFIHGKSVSKGCIAVGDEAIEELYGLVSDTGIGRVRVIIAPFDFRKGYVYPETPEGPSWVSELYKTIGREMAEYGRTGPGDEAGALPEGWKLYGSSR